MALRQHGHLIGASSGNLEAISQLADIGFNTFGGRLDKSILGDYSGPIAICGSPFVYFGPKAPASKESNWVPTTTDGGFEVLFRFYGPEKPLFEKTWKLPDIERIQ
jgi:Protein of unknown function (DUF1214)